MLVQYDIFIYLGYRAQRLTKFGCLGIIIYHEPYFQSPIQEINYSFHISKMTYHDKKMDRSVHMTMSDNPTHSMQSAGHCVDWHSWLSRIPRYATELRMKSHIYPQPVKLFSKIQPYAKHARYTAVSQIKLLTHRPIYHYMYTMSSHMHMQALIGPRQFIQ